MYYGDEENGIKPNPTFVEEINRLTEQKTHEENKFIYQLIQSIIFHNLH